MFAVANNFWKSFSSLKWKENYVYSGQIDLEFLKAVFQQLKPFNRRTVFREKMVLDLFCPNIFCKEFIFKYKCLMQDSMPQDKCFDWCLRTKRLNLFAEIEAFCSRIDMIHIYNSCSLFNTGSIFCIK